MEKCIKCGRDIDIIAKNPEKIFFCSRCSEKLMEKQREKKSDEDYISKFKRIYYTLIPGTYQKSRVGLLKGFIYLYGSIMLPLFFMLIIYLLETKEFLNIQVKGISLIFLMLLCLNSIVIYIENYLEIRKEQR